MSQEHLGTYLNDHLAGSTLALELLEHLEKTHPDTELGDFAEGLRGEIQADRHQLELLMDRLGVSPSSPRKALSWFAEKALQVKLRLDDPAGGALRRLEMLEVVSMGIEGKRMLWRTLAAAGVDVGPEVNQDQLQRRAEQQRQQVEQWRLQAAREALGGS